MSEPILVVDDDPLQVETLTEIFRMYGWDVRGATSGEEAIAVVAERPQGVVLMDIKMPGMNGVSAMRAIRGRWPDVKVMLMTGYSGAELIEEALRAGAARVWSKPVDIRSLLASLEPSE